MIVSNQKFAIEFGSLFNERSAGYGYTVTANSLALKVMREMTSVCEGETMHATSHT